jgi:hypothetical protein
VILWSVQELQKLRRLSLLDTNITPLQYNKMQAASSLHSALFNYTPLVIGRTDKNMQLTIIKPTQTGINRNKKSFCIMKSSEPPKISKTSRVP